MVAVGGTGVVVVVGWSAAGVPHEANIQANSNPNGKRVSRLITTLPILRTYL
jgi:hypothetical protein